MLSGTSKQTANAHYTPINKLNIDFPCTNRESNHSKPQNNPHNFTIQYQTASTTFQRFENLLEQPKYSFLLNIYKVKQLQSLKNRKTITSKFKLKTALIF
ncbi:hypothetical protein ACOSQ3_000030 [Xanthoceras sorbifolium]